MKASPKLFRSDSSSSRFRRLRKLGWRGIENGALLDLMAPQFQTLITTDKNIPHQQNFEKRGISAIILPTNEIPLVIELLNRIEELLSVIRPGEVIAIAKQ